MASAVPSSFPAPEGSPAGRPRLLVVGCGGIGGVVAAHLLEQGHDVTALTTNPLIADAINVGGFRVRGEGGPGTVRGQAMRALPKDAAPFDYVLLATQPPQVEEAARSALAALAPRGAMVCFQNGLCERRVGAIAGDDRTFGAVVAWGASMVEPGVYERTSAGGFVLGRLDGAEDPRLDELARIFEAIGPSTVTANLAGARWSKLAINAAISALGTLGGDRLGVLMRHRHVRRLALEIMTETVDVARALGVRLEKVAGTLDLDWIALTEAERTAAGSPGLVAKHALLLAVGARYRRLRSSMLSAIERGREPAVEFLNGEVASRGAELGVRTPINAAIRDEVLAIARGEVRPGLDRTRAFYERTRALLTTRAPVMVAVVERAPSPLPPPPAAVEAVSALVEAPPSEPAEAALAEKPEEGGTP
jgi:2-dehydropantoate 2-reductase